jgi:C4-dicarboxylate-specific signal transduction histidine kinase
MIESRVEKVCKVYIDGVEYHKDFDSSQYTFESNIDTEKIEQVWLTILNNSIDELAKSSSVEKRRIDIFVNEGADIISVRFKDNAGGINEDILSHVFEPFVSKKSEKGIGINLSIAKRIVDMHNGLIKAYNEDHGAVFEVVLAKQ